MRKARNMTRVGSARFLFVCAFAAGPLGVSCKEKPPPAPLDSGLRVNPVVREWIQADTGAPALDTKPDAALLDAASPDAAPIGLGPEGDAGAVASSCTRIYGPEEQPFRGTPLLLPEENNLALVWNDLGQPKVQRIPIPPLTAPPRAPTVPRDVQGLSAVPCAIGGKYMYCLGKEGAIFRGSSAISAAPAPFKEITKGRPGTRIVAAPLAGEHSVVAFLLPRRTTEGNVLEAWAAADTAAPIRISDDGSGATAVDLATQGEKVLAFTIDARAAMTPMHGRQLVWENGKMNALPDVVVHVGGAPQPGIVGQLAHTGASLWALVPMPEDASTFGMAILPIADPPKMDVKATFSGYPNGIDPAPVASAEGQGKTYVARVRPKTKEFHAPSVVELGSLSSAGAFTSLMLLGEGRPLRDLTLAVDGKGTVWLSYGDATGTWLERIRCK